MATHVAGEQVAALVGDGCHGAGARVAVVDVADLGLHDDAGIAEQHAVGHGDIGIGRGIRARIIGDLRRIDRGGEALVADLENHARTVVRPDTNGLDGQRHHAVGDRICHQRADLRLQLEVRRQRRQVGDQVYRIDGVLIVERHRDGVLRDGAAGCYPPGSYRGDEVDDRRHRQADRDGRHRNSAAGHQGRHAHQRQGDVGNRRLVAEVDGEVVGRHRRTRDQDIAAGGQSREGRRCRARHAIGADHAVIYHRPPALQRAVDAGGQRYLLEEIDGIAGVGAAVHRYRQLQGAGDGAAGETEREGIHEGERPGAAADHRQRQLVLCDGGDGHVGVGGELADAEADGDAIGVLDDSALGADHLGVGDHRLLHLNLHHAFAVGPQNLDIDEAVGDAVDDPIGIHGGDAAVHRDVGHAIGGTDEGVGQRAEAGDDGARGAVRDQGDRGRIGVDVVEISHQLIAIRWRADTHHRGRGNQPAAGGHDGGAVTHTGQDAVRRQGGDGGVGDLRIDVAERHQHAGLVSEVGVDLDFGVGAGAAEQGAQLVEVDMNQGSGADVHIQCRLRGLGEAVVGHDGEGGLPGIAGIGGEQQVRAVGLDDGAGVHRVDNAVGERIAVGIDGDAGEIDHRRQIDMRHVARQRRFHHRRQAGGDAVIGGDQLGVGGVDHAVAIHIGGWRLRCFQGRVDSVHHAGEIDVASE